MFEKLNIADTSEIIFKNSRLNDSIKFRLIKRHESLDHLFKEHNLLNFVLGTASLNDIKKLLPKKRVQLFDLTLNPRELVDYLRHFELNNFNGKVTNYIKKAVRDLIKNYDNSQSFYAKFSSPIYSYQSMVWVNALSTLFLLKWFLHENERDNKKHDVHRIINSGLKWLQNNFTRNKTDIHQYIITSNKPGELSKTIKMYETSLVLQLLLRTRKSKALHFNIGLEFGPIVDQLMDIKDSYHINNQTMTRWPSNLSVDEELANYVDSQYSSDVGSTSLVLQLLSEITRKDSGVKLSKIQLDSVKKEIIHGILWLIHQQDINGSWGRKSGISSVEQSCLAIQSILKLDLMIKENLLSRSSFSKQNIQLVLDSVNKGIKWLSNQFCLNNRDTFIYAWPEEDLEDGAISNRPCCKNTSLAVSTLLKAGANPNSFLIVKPILWLLNVTPLYQFDNIYKYCALVDYLRVSRSIV